MPSLTASTQAISIGEGLGSLGYEPQVTRLMYVGRSHEPCCELAGGGPVSHRLVRTLLYRPVVASLLASPWPNVLAPRPVAREAILRL
jgi:hypothetical protein